MKLYDNTPTVDLDVCSTATGSTVIYVGVVQDLKVKLTNRTGKEITFSAGDHASCFEIVLPSFYTSAEISRMSVTDLPGWTCKATDYTLQVTIDAAAQQPWVNDSILQFTIKGAQTNDKAAPEDIAVNFVNMAGDNIPGSQHVTLTPAMPPVDGKADLRKLLDISLDNQGVVFVSPGYTDKLANKLFLNIKNKSGSPLFTGSATSGRNKNAAIQISFVAGQTTGALAPGEHIEQIRCSPYVSQALFDWSARPDEDKAGGWKLTPANTNTGLLGTDENANVSFMFSDIVTANPLGYTQMILRFTGFSKDDKTDYNDFVHILNINKQPPPPTRGIQHFYSQEALFTVNGPGQPVSFQLNWSMIFVDRITLITNYMGHTPYIKTYTAGTPLQYDHYKVTIPSVAQSMPVFVTIQAYDGNGGFLNSLQFSVFIQSNSFTDPRDHQVYPAVKIGNQLWMARNLDYFMEGKSFVLGNNAANEPKYGRLYYWEAAMQNLPDGWRLPALEDWQNVLQVYGSAADAYKAMTGAGGFNAQMGGDMDNLKSFTDDANGYYWTSTRQDAHNICYARFDSSSRKLNLLNTLPPDFALSIRYVKDL